MSEIDEKKSLQQKLFDIITYTDNLSTIYNSLNAKQKKFVIAFMEYLIENKGDEWGAKRHAYLKAGYSKKSQNSGATKRTQNDRLSEALNIIRKYVQEKALIELCYGTREAMLQSQEIMKKCMQAKAVMIWDKEDKEYIQKKEEIEGEKIGMWTADFRGALLAHEQMIKMMGLYEKDNKQKTQDPVNFIINTEEKK